MKGTGKTTTIAAAAWALSENKAVEKIDTPVVVLVQVGRVDHVIICYYVIMCINPNRWVPHFATNKRSKNGPFSRSCSNSVVESGRRTTPTRLASLSPPLSGQANVAGLNVLKAIVEGLGYHDVKLVISQDYYEVRAGEGGASIGRGPFFFGRGPFSLWEMGPPSASSRCTRCAQGGPFFGGKGFTCLGSVYKYAALERWRAT